MFEIGENVKVNDRKMKTHNFVGKVLSVDETIEKTRTYMVELQLQNREGKNLKSKKVTILKEDQLEKNYE